MNKNLARVVLYSLLYISIFTVQTHLWAVDESEVMQTIINLDHEGDSLDALRATFKEIPSLLSGRVRITNSLLCTGPVQINPTPINGPSLSVSGGSMFNGNVDVSGTVTTKDLMAETLTVPNQSSFGDTTVNGNLSVTNNASIGGNTTIGGALTASAGLTAGATVINGTLTTTGNVSAGGNLSVANNVTIGGTTTVNDLNAQGNVTVTGNLFSQDLNMTPIAPPAATNDGILFVSDGTAPATNTGDLYYRLPLSQGGTIVDVLSGGGSSGVVSLSQGNGIILSPNPITTTGVISANSTSANTANTLVQRDASGNFSAGTITANLTGAASMNVLKSGDSMSGTLNMLNQNSIRFQDSSGFGNYAGIRAPAAIGSNYTLALPATGPLGGQFLQANVSNPLNLEWITPGGGTQPAASKIIYVTKYGNDATGDGSFIKPYASLTQALILANSLSSNSNPITISIAPGIYVENNTVAPLSITALGISIVGESSSSTIIMPASLANGLLQTTVSTLISNVALVASSPSSAAAITTAATNGVVTIRFVTAQNFATGISFGGSGGTSIANQCTFIGNQKAVSVNNVPSFIISCLVQGSLSGTTSANTGIELTGSNANVTISTCTLSWCNNGFTAANNAIATCANTAFRFNNYDAIQTSGSNVVYEACIFDYNQNTTDIDVQISGAGTEAEFVSCFFRGKNLLGVPTGSALQVSGGAHLDINSGEIEDYQTALTAGNPGDTSSTELSASGLKIAGCTNDFVQQGSSTVNLSACSLADDKITINDGTNVTTAFFNLDANNTLHIGSFENVNTTLLEVANMAGLAPQPALAYRPSLYSSQAIGYVDTPSSTWFTVSGNAASTDTLTTDRTQTTNLRLMSDTGSPLGATGALRGWDITKAGTSAELSFNYQNTDSVGQSVISQYTLMKLDGVNNQLQLPTAGTKLVFAGDTNLYRSSASTLKTDGSLAVGSLTANRAVATNASQVLTSSVTTDTELGYLSGTTSSVQGQLNNKVSKTGDSMSGTLNMLNQTAIRFQDGSGLGNYAGINAPVTVSHSYTVSLPATGPLGGQVLQADAIQPTHLNWVTQGGSVTPVASRTVYVSTFGNDTTGDGSFDKPYATLARALTTANAISSASNPVMISIGSGVYVEDNSAGALQITAEGITVTGGAIGAAVITPGTPANNLLSSVVSATISDITFDGGGSTATAISLSGNSVSTLSNVTISSFGLGVSCTGTPTSVYSFESCFFVNNTIGITINDVSGTANNCIIQGAPTLAGPAANTGVVTSGANSIFIFNSGVCGLCQTGFVIGSNTRTLTASSVPFKLNGNDVIVTGGAKTTLNACSFELNIGNNIKIQASGAGTQIECTGCTMDGRDSLGVPMGTAFKVFNQAHAQMSNCSLANFTTAIQAGESTDTSATEVLVSGTVVGSCTNDIVQQGATTLNVSASTLATAKITINNSTNVGLSYTDPSEDNALHIGSKSNASTILLEALIGNHPDNPEITYLPSLYSTRAIGQINDTSSASLFTLSPNDSYLAAVTTDRTYNAGLRLFSDTGSPVGATGALRGWELIKTGSSGNLQFSYQNSDSVGQSIISPFTLMQLDGVNNQLQLPTSGTQIVFGGDTNLYRSAANTLKTDDSLAIGTLTANRAVATNGSQVLTSSITTDTELGYLSGTTSSVQNQLNNKVSKTGDSMSGALNMLNQTAVRFQDGSGLGNYAGINAPVTVNSSYTVSLPATGPLAGQVLQAGAITPNNLTWVTQGGGVAPASSQTVYVTKFGNDTTGDGSFDKPYASLGKAINVANGISSLATPVTIMVSSGVYIEDNSAGPLTITAAGITITGDSYESTIIMPSSLSNNFILITASALVENLAITASALSSGIGISFTNSSSYGTLRAVWVSNFNTGISCSGSGSSYTIDQCSMTDNGTAAIINATSAIVFSSIIYGSTTGTPGNTGIVCTGANSQLSFSSNVLRYCNTALSATNNAIMMVSDVTFAFNHSDIVQTGGSEAVFNACIFEYNPSPSDIDVQVSGPGTSAEFVGSFFRGKNSLGVPTGTAVKVYSSGSIVLNAAGIEDYQTGAIVGDPGDTASTELTIANAKFSGCTQDILQQGSSTLLIEGVALSSDKVSINDSTNVQAMFFNTPTGSTLHVGSFTDVDTQVLHVATNSGPTISEEMKLQYRSSLYGAPALGFEKDILTPVTSYTLSHETATNATLTTDRTQTALLRLMSDTGSPLGATGALRGWDIIKEGTSGSLSFDYQNSDSVGQSVIPQYTLMKLDGVNNQLQLPTTGTQLVFGGDTNLYRSGANTLKTDDTLVVGTLTANRAVATDGSQALVSSATTATELGYLSGTTSSVQTQLNNKLNLSGGTLTGTLTVQAGSAATPSLQFAGSTDTGISAGTANTLSFDTNGAERMKISSAGTVSINGFTTAGVVHNDASGNLTSSLIVNADVDPAAGIVDTKLATISTAGKVANSATTATSADTANAIVLRDASGNFSAGTITASLTGAASLNVLKAGDTMTGSLTLPAGTDAAPSLKFNGSTNTGLSAATTNVLGFDTNGQQRMSIDGSGTVSINGFTSSGVVHNNASGALSSSLIVNGDITDGTIANSKLATASSANNPNYLVLRDGSGNFTTNKITISGSVTNATDAATKSYVDSVAATGLSPHAPAVVLGNSNITLSGTQTIDSVPLSANDRVLLVAQTNPVENGLWLVQLGAWTRPTDFANGSTAGGAYVLILSGATYAGSSWLCSTPTAVIGTDPIIFDEFSLPSQVNAANVGIGQGQVFRDKTGVTLNFKTILGATGTHVVVTNNTNEVALSTDATPTNTVGTLVSRDSSGNFSAGTITANLTGSASNNVLKAGDSMSGPLEMLTQNELRFDDAAGGQYVALHAPSVLNGTYSLALPATGPLAGQVLRAGSLTAYDLEWLTLSSGIVPSTARAVYVATYGNDTTGDGSALMPYASLAKALDTANGISSSSNPVAIIMAPGVYVENNTVGALSITAAGISIVGESSDATIIVPASLTNNLLQTTVSALITNIGFNAIGSSSAAAISTAASSGGITLRLVSFQNFQTGVIFGGSNTRNIANQCGFIGNGTAIQVNNVPAIIVSCIIQGTALATPINTGISVSGAGATVTINGCTLSFCDTACSITNNANGTCANLGFRSNNYDVIQTLGSNATYEACLFNTNNNSTDIDVQIHGSGTTAKLMSCFFNGKNSLGNGIGSAVKVSGGATLEMNGGLIEYYQTALTAGDVSDTSSTQLIASGVSVVNSTTDLFQQGSATVNLSACSLAEDQIIINDPTFVTTAFFNLAANNTLTIGSFNNTNTTLLEVASATGSGQPSLVYKPSLYSTAAIGYLATQTASWFTASAAAAETATVTTDRTQPSSLRLMSDTGSPLGATGALRGWDIIKQGTSGSLLFDYQNSDVIGQSVIPQYTLMTLDGVNNQLQLPTTGTQLVFGGDTNLYRSGVNTLKTDDTLVVGTLTANRAVATDGSQALVSSVTTATELGYLSGTTSSVQTQLNNKLNLSGGTLTGTLTLPAGSAATPSLQFTGSTNTGISAGTANTLSFDTNGAERMKISSAGTVSINGLTTAGVVHNDASGNLSSSLIVNADVDPAAAIVDTKLSTISTAGKVSNSATTATSANTANAIVSRDASGNFSAGTASVSGLTYRGSSSGTLATTVPSTVTSYTLTWPSAVAGSNGQVLTSDTSGNLSWAPVPSTANTITNGGNSFGAPISIGTQDGFSTSLIANNINRLSISASGAISLLGNTTLGAGNTLTYTGATSGTVTTTVPSTVTSYTLTYPSATAASASSLVGDVNGNLSWLGYTNTNTPSTLVERDGSGNFSAATITAALIGNVTGSASLNVLKTGDTMTGALTLAAGSSAIPSLQFTGSTNTGISAGTANTLSFDTNGAERMKISSAGTVSINGFTAAGVVHNDASGNLTSSLIVNADVDPAAAIVDTKLATISTAGKVANSATTATSADTANAIVSRDASGNFSAGTASVSGLTYRGASSGTLATTVPSTVTSYTLTWPSAVAGSNGQVLTSDTSGNLSWAPVPSTANTITNGGNSFVAPISIGTQDGFSTSLIANNINRLSISASGAISLLGNTTLGAGNTLTYTGATSGTVTTTVPSTVTSYTLTYPSATAATASSLIGDVNGNLSWLAYTTNNTASTLVQRDASGNFSAGTVTANLIGNVTGSASLNVLRAGDTMTGALTLPAGSAAIPSLQFTGSTNTGISAGTANTLSFDTNGAERMKISSAGTVSINGFTAAGVVHNDASGNLTSSLIVNADVDPAAAIVDTKLATISTAGKVANTATTATSANTANTIVLRDASGNFSAGTITATLTGAASLNVLKAGDTMTGNLTLPAGTTAAPSLNFTGSTTTGFSLSAANTLSLSAAGVETMRSTSTDLSVIARLLLQNVICNQAILTVAPTNGSTVTTNVDTSILALSHNANRTGVTIVFPPTPTNGQLFTIMLATTNSISFTNNGNGASIVNAITTLNPGANFNTTGNGASVAYIYLSSTNTWYRIGRG